MKIGHWNIDKVKPYQHNPRVNDAAVAAVAASIRQFGWQQPIVVDRKGVIIVGHTRWKAARKLGLKTVPVHVASDLTPAHIKAYRIADNKVGELAQWDLDLLAEELAELGPSDRLEGCRFATGGARCRSVRLPGLRGALER